MASANQNNGLPATPGTFAGFVWDSITSGSLLTNAFTGQLTPQQQQKYSGDPGGFGLADVQAQDEYSYIPKISIGAPQLNFDWSTLAPWVGLLAIFVGLAWAVRKVL